MSVYGIGAMYGGKNDVSEQFLKKNVACIGWSKNDASTLHFVLNGIKTGDIIYIKSHPPHVGLIIKAVGIVVEPETIEDSDLGAGKKVKWVWSGNERLGKIKDKYPVRNMTIYEEYNQTINSRVISLLLEK